MNGQEVVWQRALERRALERRVLGANGGFLRVDPEAAFAVLLQRLIWEIPPLPERERRALMLRLGWGSRFLHSRERTASCLNVDPSEVPQLEEAALRELSARLERLMATLKEDLDRDLDLEIVDPEELGEGELSPTRLLSITWERAFGLCQCGHSGAGKDSDHGKAPLKREPGHGACQKCDCRAFVFAGYTPEYEAARREALRRGRERARAGRSESDRSEPAETLDMGLVKTLSYREREIFKLRLGIPGGRVYTLEEVGAIFKISRERVAQIEAGLWKKLRDRLGHKTCRCGGSP